MPKQSWFDTKEFRERNGQMPIPFDEEFRLLCEKQTKRFRERGCSYLPLGDTELISGKDKASNTAHIARKSEIFSSEAENYSGRVLSERGQKRNVRKKNSRLNESIRRSKVIWKSSRRKFDGSVIQRLGCR